MLPSEGVSRVSALMQMGFPYHTDHRTPFFSWPPLRWLFEEAEVTKSLQFLGPETKGFYKLVQQLAQIIHPDGGERGEGEDTLAF